MNNSISTKDRTATNSVVHCACQRGALAVFAGILLSAAISYGATSTWRGQNGLGGDGTWVTGDFVGGAPTSSQDILFTISDTYTNPTARVTISGTTPKAKSILVTNGKNVVLSLSSGAMLTVGTGVLGVGASGTPAASSSSLTIEGPASGLNATLNAARLFLSNNTANVGTAHRNTLLISGSNLSVNLTGGFNSFNGRSGVTFAGGVKVTTAMTSGTSVQNASGAFYARSGKVGNVYDNYIRIQDASVAAAYFRVEGLLQLGKNSVLTTSAAATPNPLEIAVQIESSTSNPGGRFEIEGSGLAADALTTIYTGGTFAVGLSDINTGARSEAGSATLNSRVSFKTGSFLELSLFEGGGDQITLGETGWIDNQGTGAKLVLKLDGSFVPEAGTSWSLFDIDPANLTGITGSFDLSLVNTQFWDLSSFNQAGGWTVTSIPEPQTNALILLASTAGIAWSMKRKRSAA